MHNGIWLGGGYPKRLSLEHAQNSNGHIVSACVCVCVVVGT